ncbi:hypothetical protein XM38_006790 [Halomicronema hongdechloris C2206]|uniref:Uncharacterized protein n=1 Tax=Halomicronema hongdechloris C2206 TaxID=1641165 RepID=A0A1Z3HHJ8_9CYAN|nr:hypothetical protein [Halomicronema hongdechloris]ASC69750.1 hypothetical protein XM38_006790 [Halomicronema hongdechloris C2206]
MAGLYNLIRKIHQQPGLYVGTPSISNLYMFLCGYAFSRQEQGLEITAEEKEFEKFQTWIQQRFKISATVSWAQIILLHAADERSGFELFFELFSEFLAQHQDSENQQSIGQDRVVA